MSQIAGKTVAHVEAHYAVMDKESRRLCRADIERHLRMHDALVAEMPEGLARTEFVKIFKEDEDRARLALALVQEQDDE